ncbi:MAG: exonuclease subunit SbcD [Spirochaeta sp.]|nr:exonuclease subunit SbcD [Spirochaeta sp.]
MKILHTADWHIGKRLDRFSRIEEQRAVLAEIATIAAREHVDVCLVAGDLYDTVNPGSEAEEVLYRGLTDLSGGGARPVIAIAGNHDSPDRINAPDVLARQHGIILIGYPAADIPEISGAAAERIGFSLHAPVPGLAELHLGSHPGIPLRILTTPYANEYRLHAALIPDTAGSTADALLQDTLRAHWSAVAGDHLGGNGIDLLVTHLFFADDPAAPPDEPDSERPIGHVGGAPPLPTNIVPDQVQYVACGHLHRPHTLSGPCPVRYAGSPLSYSFAEAEQTKSVTIIEVEPHGNLGDVPTIRTVPLTSGRGLVRITADEVSAAQTALTANVEAYVELSLHLPDFLSGSDRNLLHTTHPRIVTIVPIVETDHEASRRDQIDPTADISELFTQYFTREHGTAPSAEIRGLFQEVLSEAGERTE